MLFRVPLGRGLWSGLGLTLLIFWGTRMVNPLVTELVKRFKAIFNKPPRWAWQLKPSIPLIGEKHKPGKGLVIYASAENLSWLNGQKPPARFLGEKAWNRYRLCYEEQGRNTDDFFPDVGIRPANDGGLFAAGLFIAQKTSLPTRAKPRSFLETIAITNWCKFSIKKKTNRDYVADVRKLTESLPYAISELAVLQPKVALLPKAIWRHAVLRAAMIGASPSTRFLPVPQFNARVVNIHLKRHDRKAARLKRKSAGTPLALWMKKLNRINHDHAWRYVGMLSSQF